MTLETRGTGRMRVGNATTARESADRAALRLFGLYVINAALESIAAKPRPSDDTYDRNQLAQEQRVAHLFLASGWYYPWDEAAGISAERIKSEYRRRIAAESPQVGG